MKILFYGAVVLLIFGISPGLSSQAQGQSLRFEHLQADLPYFTPTSIVQDHQGFLWIGTHRGLYKYDGYQFTSYRNDPYDPHSLISDFVWVIYEDRDGTLWVGSQEGVSRFERETEHFTHFRHDPEDSTSLSHSGVGAIHEDRSGTLWVGTLRGLNRLDRETGSFTRFRADPNNPHTLGKDNVWTLHTDQTGVLWIGTGSGLHRLNRDTETETFTRFGHDPEDPRSLSNNTVRAIHEDRSGTLWVGTGAGLNRFDRATETFVRYLHDSGDPGSLSNNHVWAISEDDAGILWLSTRGGGLNRYDPERGTFAHYTHDPADPTSLRSNFIGTIYEDRSGVLWIATHAGLSRLNRSVEPFQYYSSALLDPDRQVHIAAIHEDREGILWIGTGGNDLRGPNGLYVFDRKLGTASRVRYATHSGCEKNERVYAIAEDRHENVWLATGCGLNRYDRERDAHTLFVPRPDCANCADNEITAVYEDRKGRIWITNVDKQLLQFDAGSRTFRRFEMDPTQGDSDSPSIQEDRSGKLWVGWFWEGGLDQFDPETESISRFRHDQSNPNSLSSNWVLALHVDRKGALWIGTISGLNRLNPGKPSHFEHFTEQNSELPHNWVLGIEEDRQGNLWLSTGAGLVRFDPRAETFRSYAVHRGLLPVTFIPGSTHRSMTGELFFGGEESFVSFFPEQVSDNPYPPRVVLTGFKLIDEPVEPGKDKDAPLRSHIAAAGEIRLAHRQNDISFEYVGLHFNNPAANQYAYMLEGYDREWRHVGTRRTVTYTNLRPGEYVFRAKAANSDGIWNEEGTSIQVVILPPWWRTPWAYAAYVLLFVSGLLAVGRLQRSRLIRRERQRSQFREAELRTAALEAENGRKELELEKAREVEAMNVRLRAHEERLQRQNALLEEQTQRLQALDEAKSRFFANLSHEFRTPLTLILGPVESALSGTYGILPGPLRDQLRHTRHQAQRLLRLVNQLLDLARIESGKMSLNARRNDLVAFLQGIVRAFVPLAERRRISLQFRPEKNTLPMAFDPDKLEKAFSNLLSNALKFTPEGGKVWIVVSAPAVSEETARPHVDVAVKDTGPGIAQEALGRIFDRFEQVDGSTTREHEGTGIGLSLAKELVELHGGKILVESEEGFGTAFTVRLPVDEKPVTEVREEAGDGALMLEQAVLMTDDAKHDRADEPPSEPGEFNILIVEDNPEVQAFLRSGLDGDYHIIEASDGASGLEAARQHRPDLILSDVMMPRMDGYTFCRTLKEDATLRHIPVILLTARAAEADMIHGLDDGADDYVTKPFSIEELHARMRRLIASRRALRAQFSGEVVVRPSDVVIQAEDEAFLAQMLAVIEIHLDETSFGVDMLAEEVGLGRRQLERRTRAVTGQTPSELIRRMRLERAAQLLEARAGTVSEVAYSVGYRSASHFSTAFREQFGISPSKHFGKAT